MSDSEQAPGGEILVYTAEDGTSRIRVLLEDETVWLTQAMMAELYGTSVPNINIHNRNVLEENALRAEATIKEYLIVRREGSRQVERPAWKQSRKRQENAGVITKWRAAV